MSSSVRHRFKFLLPCLMLFGLLLGAAPAQAQISCSSVSMTNLNFGNIDPLSSQANFSATLNYICSNTDKHSTHSALLCFSIGEPGGAQTNPRLMTSGNNKLKFQMYQNANLTTVWGSQMFGDFRTPLQVPITLAKNANTAGSATLYGQVSGGQTDAVPGNYQDVYQNGDTALTVNDVKRATPPTTCDSTSVSVYFPFTVSATVIKNCTVAAGISPINLGTVAPTATNVSGNTSISVACSKTTPYYIGLLPSNGNTGGAGVMSGTGGNSDRVPYQLYSNPGLTAIWGNTATSTSAGNGVAGIGTGTAQFTTVYAKVPSADFQPDNYTDTVTVNVNY